MRVPFSTPEGMRTVTVRSVAVRPWPEQPVQGLSITSPWPSQVGQGAIVTIWPSSDCWTRWTWPEPLQAVQRVGLVPGSAQEPEQRSHSTAVRKVTSCSVPKTTSRSSIFTRRSTSPPRRWRGTGPWLRPRIPEAPANMSKMSLKSNPAPPPGKPPMPGPPPMSYWRRLSAWERVSYAWETFLNFSAASGSGLTSGWRVRASLRYAFLISSVEASRETPSSS